MTRFLLRRYLILAAAAIALSVALLAAAQKRPASEAAVARKPLRNAPQANTRATTRVSMGRPALKSLDEKARLLGLTRDDVGAPFTVSARQTYVPGKAALYTQQADVDAINDNIVALPSKARVPVAVIVIHLSRTVKGKKILAECHVLSKSGGQLTMYVASGASNIAQRHDLARDKPTTASFVIDPRGNGTTGLALLQESGADWALKSCTFTPQK